MTGSAPKIDDLAYWANAMQRLSRAAESLQGATQPEGARADEIFAQRAHGLAAVQQDESRSSRLDLIAFEVGSQRVAIESRYIHAVVPNAEPTPVPGAPGILAGVINFRGGILPVFRLERLLGAGDAPRGGTTIVLGEHRPEFAFFAHAIEEVAELSPGELHRVPWQGANDAPAALGISEGALNVLDGRALLSDRRFYIGRQPAARM